ncbi:MJ0042-type zinc finger domain-containing protein [Alicyclobacillus sendaiensis]|uniref:MJ0042-type zinc finger domain-containing protein n=1 Tax=Alicyclobacillus sendaiensis TaxID=192387 RepID=UPI000A54D7F8
MEPKDFFKGDSADLKCPGCRNKFSVAAESLFIPDTVVRCPLCNAEIRLDNREAIDTVQRTLDDLSKLLRKQTTHINLKL